MGVQAPQPNSAMVVSNVGSPLLVETQAPLLDSASVISNVESPPLMETPAPRLNSAISSISELAQDYDSSNVQPVSPSAIVHPLTPEEEEILLVNTMAGGAFASGSSQRRWRPPPWSSWLTPGPWLQPYLLRHLMIYVAMITHN